MLLPLSTYLHGKPSRDTVDCVELCLPCASVSVESFSPGLIRNLTRLRLNLFVHGLGNLVCVVLPPSDCSASAAPPPAPPTAAALFLLLLLLLLLPHYYY